MIQGWERSATRQPKRAGDAGEEGGRGRKERTDMKNHGKLNNRLIGSAGEYFVAGELSRNGVVAALTRAGTDAFDILAVNRCGQQFAIQVKTTKDAKSTWLLGAKDEETRATHYVFVRLNGEELPECYVVPAPEVAAAIRAGHQAWRKAKEGRTENGMREFQIAEHDPRYYRRWDYFQRED